MRMQGIGLAILCRMSQADFWKSCLQSILIKVMQVVVQEIKLTCGVRVLIFEFLLLTFFDQLKYKQQLRCVTHLYCTIYVNRYFLFEKSIGSCQTIKGKRQSSFWMYFSSTG